MKKDKHQLPDWQRLHVFTSSTVKQSLLFVLRATLAWIFISFIFTAIKRLKRLLNRKPAGQLRMKG